MQDHQTENKPRNGNALILFMVFIAVFVISKNWWRIELLIDPIDNVSLSERDVILYTTRWCPYCEKTRRFLNSANIPYTEYDVEQSETAYREYERISGLGVPVIRIGNRIVQGYSPDAIKSAIRQLKPASPVSAE